MDVDKKVVEESALGAKEDDRVEARADKSGKRSSEETAGDIAESVSRHS